jgi:hypothetical protein
MDGPPDPADTAFQRLLNREILLSERRRMLILAALQAFILVLILLTATFVPGFVRSIYHDRLPVRGALAAFSAFVAYELFAAGLLTIFIRRGRNFPVLGRYVNAFVETSFPTVLLYLLAGYLFAPAVFGTWTALLYFLFIILSTLRLDFALSAFTGTVTAVQLFVLAMIILHLEWRSDDPDFSIGYHLTRSAVLLVAGLLAGYVGATIKSHFHRALAAASARDEVTNLFGQHVKFRRPTCEGSSVLAASRPKSIANGRQAQASRLTHEQGAPDMIDDFDKLQQQYFDATPEERERLLPDFIQAIRENLPGLIEAYDARAANGDYLKDMFDQCIKRGLARPDLSPGRKTNAMEDAADFMRFFDAAKQWPLPKLATHAFEMALRALFIGMRAGLSPGEVDELRAKIMSEHQRNIAVQGGERRRDKPWRQYAKQHALRLHNTNRALTLTDIAKKIEKQWESENFEKVELQQLFKYLSDCVDNGELPSSMKRPKP